MRLARETLRLRRRQTELLVEVIRRDDRAELGHRESRLVRELPIEEVRMRPADLVGLDDLVSRRVLELGELVHARLERLHCGRNLGYEGTVDRRFDVSRLFGGRLRSLAGDVAGLGVLGLRQVLHNLMDLPLRKAPAQRVERRGGRHPENGEDQHPPHEAGERHQEAEARAEVGAEKRVDRAAEQQDPGGDGEDTDHRRVPQTLVGDAFSSEQRQLHGAASALPFSSVRSKSTIARIWSVVSTLWKCGMRPDEMPRTPYCW